MTQLDSDEFKSFISAQELSAVNERSMIRRRFVFLFLVGVTCVSLLLLFFAATSQNGVTALQIILALLFAMTLPWTAIGFWNAVFGLWLLRFTSRPEERVCPPLADLSPQAALAGKTAILFCIRNEDVDLVRKNALTVLRDLSGTSHSSQFEAFILSDSFEQDIIGAEEALFNELSDEFDASIKVYYRRRDDNKDFKAGNIREFCTRHGKRFDYALVLDADSVMSANAICRLVQILDLNPRLGIVQSLVTGLPAASAFARLFQFGMRLGMRSYTLGSAWWQGDCGPYWGHNALIRLKPFIEHCALPTLPGNGPLSGPVLSHDQVEAVLMRRAGFEVRVVALEDESWEANPTTLIEFVRRDLRWCLGNMQYFKLLGLKKLKPVSRLQLWLAILMFLSAPAWLGFVVIGALSMSLSAALDAPLSLNAVGLTLYAIVMTMIFAPKLATLIDVLMSSRVRAQYGSRFRLLGSFFAEVLFSMLLAPIMAILVTRFIFGLAFGRRLGWTTQNRNANGVSFRLAADRLWLPTMFGAAGVLLFTQVGGFAALIALPLFIGPLISIPFAMVTAHSGQGLLLSRHKIACIPEEIRRPALLDSYQIT